MEFKETDGFWYTLNPESDYVIISENEILLNGNIHEVKIHGIHV
jgi:hypothetical protein